MHNKRRKKALIHHPTEPSPNNLYSIEEDGYRENHEVEHEHESHKAKKKNPPLKALNEPQRQLIRAIIEDNQVIVIGPAGTGKTYITVRMACDALRRGEFEKIILTRPNVSCSKSIGFFPGTLNDKLAPWVAPMTQIMSEELGKSHFEYLLKKDIIQIIPFEVLRGHSFKNAMVLVDECQSITVPEAKLMLSRIGEGSKLIMCGDIKQKDIREKSGLEHMIYLRNKYSIEVPLIEFTHRDIVRSDICAIWITAFEQEDEDIH